MDFDKAIRELRRQMECVDQAIQFLESFVDARRTRPAAGKRGRKQMGARERRQVSLRMKRYWEKRRKARRSAAAAGS